MLESYLDLIDACDEHDVLLVSLSKTSTGSFLGEALLRLDEAPDLPAGIDLESNPLPPLPSDMEVLYRWTDGPGHSRPLVLGMQGFGNRRGQLLVAPEQLVGAFETPRYSFEERLALLERLASAAATVSMYVRLRREEDPIRVDVLASAVVPESIQALQPRCAARPNSALAILAFAGSFGMVRTARMLGEQPTNGPSRWVVLVNGASKERGIRARTCSMPCPRW